MLCRACGKESADDFPFCPYCGKQRVNRFVCAGCGEGSPGEFSFCPRCGQPFLPAPAATESPTPPAEMGSIAEAATEESAPARGIVGGGAADVGTYVFGAFSIIALLVSIIKGIVPIYLAESAVWAGAAWFWHKRRGHGEFARAIVIVLAVLVAAGEIIEIAVNATRPAHSKMARDTDPFEKYAAPSGDSSPSTAPYSAYAPAPSTVPAVPSGGASSSPGGTESVPPAALPPRQERAPDAKTHGLREHAKDRLGEAHRLDDLKRYDKAAPLYQEACDDGEMDGCANLGALYTKGLGVAQDYERGRRLTQMACDAGNMYGCIELARLYQTGKGVPLDDAQARRIYEKVCDRGTMTGCFDLGTLYTAGQGGTQDYSKAFVLFQKACDGGELAGCTGLGHLYQYGYGVDQDVDRARGLFEKTCDSGEVLGCTNLGRMYESGEGVTRDVPRALSFYKKACSGGENSACLSLLSLR